MKNSLNSKESIYEAQLETLKMELSKLPEEKICARKRGGRYVYYVRNVDTDGRRHEKYLPCNDVKQIAALCRAAYLRKLIPALEKEARCIKHFKRGYNSQAKFAAWEKLPEAYKQFIKPLFKSNEQICHEWEKASFEGNTFPLVEGARYITKKGECVRSRIELIIADMLYDLKIPYRYECKLSLPSGTIYPDFTIMHPETLEIYYIEIFGMMDNPEYEQAAFSKISKYASSNYYNHLIMFFDHKNAPINPACIKKILSAKFL